jgi:pyrroline-5-carboxylate reductase
MLKNKRITVIGAGNMGGALVTGLVSSGNAGDILAVDPDKKRLDELSRSLNIRTATEAGDELRETDIVLLAVKPQIIEEVIKNIQGIANPQALFISIAAGIGLDYLAEHLGNDRRIIRAMPNTPALVGAGITALSPGSQIREEDLKVAEALFSSVGEVVRAHEEWMDAVTALSGSGPAYVFLILEALADGGVHEGLPRDIAQKLAAHTVLGAARLLIEKKEHPGRLKDQVTSPGGTTIAGLLELEKRGLRSAIMNAVRSAAARSKELKSK